MRFVFDDITEFDNFRYNLLLIAPSKGEAKKTVSEGFVRLEVSIFPKFDGQFWLLDGTATDDILSINSAIGGSTLDFVERTVIWVKPEELKAIEPVRTGVTEYYVELPEKNSAYNDEFDKLFWEEHVLDSMMGEAKGHEQQYFQLNPDRFGKLGLLRPRGLPFEFEHVEWADRTILRWFQGDTDTRGVYTYGQR